MDGVDVVYLTFNRAEFTKFSLQRLLWNTDWGYVRKLIIYDDKSTDETVDHIFELLDSFQHTGLVVEVRQMKLGGPVAVMQHYLDSGPSILFAKIDSDTVVPPVWLYTCIHLMSSSPQLDLLGIEPPMSRKRPAGNRDKPLINPLELEPGPLRWIKTRSIGGIGLFRSNSFLTRSRLRPHGFNGVGGFTDWQLQNPDLNIGWIAPPLKVFLLDRMPIEPWKSLSEEYIKRGWQRPWGNYTLNDRELWSWCKEVEQVQALETETVNG